MTTNSPGPRRRRRIPTALALAALSVAGTAGCGSIAGGTASRPAPEPSTRASTALPICRSTIGSTIPPAGRDYTTRVPARFGWLPAQLVNEVDQGPSNGTSTPATYNAMAYLNHSAPDQSISLTVYPDAAGVPGQHRSAPRCSTPSDLPSAPSGSTNPSPTSTDTDHRYPAPPVNGAPAYWYVSRQYRATGNGNVRLVWKTRSGTWICLQGDNLGPAEVEPALEHVARTLAVGDVPLPLPVQITGVPAAARMRPAKIRDARILPGDPGYSLSIIELRFGAGTTLAQATIYVLPAGHKDALMPPNSPCKTARGLSICVSTADATTAELTDFLPGGAEDLLAHVTSLGTDPARWRPELVVATR